MNLHYYKWQCIAIDSAWELRHDEWLQFDRNLILNILGQKTRYKTHPLIFLQPCRHYILGHCNKKVFIGENMQMHFAQFFFAYGLLSEGIRVK